MVTFRKFLTSSGNSILAGRDAETNDKLIWESEPNDTILHTSAPGSPFVNVGNSPSKTDIKEAAIFCAKYSQDWRDSKRDVIVGIFVRKNMNKTKKMKAGTWEVKKEEPIRVKKGDILEFERDRKNATT